MTLPRTHTLAEVVTRARARAASEGSGEAGPDHLLECVRSHGRSVARRLLEELEAPVGVPAEPSAEEGLAGLTEEAEAALARAEEECWALDEPRVGTKHLLIALLDGEHDGPLTASRVRTHLSNRLARSSDDNWHAVEIGTGLWADRVGVPPDSTLWPLAAILARRGGLACRAMESLGVAPEALQGEVEARSAPFEVLGITREDLESWEPESRDAYLRAGFALQIRAHGVREEMGHPRLRPEHVLIHLVREDDGEAGEILRRHGLQSAALVSTVHELRGDWEP